MFAVWTALAFLGGAYYWLFLQLGSHPSTLELGQVGNGFHGCVQEKASMALLVSRPI